MNSPVLLATDNPKVFLIVCFVLLLTLQKIMFLKKKEEKDPLKGFAKSVAACGVVLRRGAFGGAVTPGFTGLVGCPAVHEGTAG